jgi:ArsR family transcriptional regulator
MGTPVEAGADRRARLALEECCPAVLTAPLTEERAQALAADLAALADPVRLRLLSMLVSAESGEVCVCEMVEPIGRSQPTVSHHLKILVEAGLIAGEKRGRWVWYRARPERMAYLRDVLA